MKNYYEILDVSIEASQREIKKAYFLLVRKYPPDRFQEQFMDIREAYETLSNEKTRTEYDLVITMSESVRMKVQTAKQSKVEGEIDKGIRLLEEVLEIQPNISFIQSILGEYYLENGNTGKAIRIFEKLVKKEPQNAGFVGHLAQSYLERGWHKKAQKSYKKALDIDDDNFSFWIGLSQTYKLAGEPQKDKQVLLKALKKGKEKDWDNITIYYHLIEVDIVLNQLDDLKKHLEELSNLALEQDDIRENVGWMLQTLADMLFNTMRIDIIAIVIDSTLKLLPDDERIQKWKVHIDKIRLLDEQFSKLNEDTEIKDEIIEYINLQILPPNALLDMKIPKEIAEIAFEEQILTDYKELKESIYLLEERHPELYEIKSDFFFDIKSAKKRKKKLKEYNSGKNLNKMFGRFMKNMPEMFIEDDYDEEDFVEFKDFVEFNEYEDFYDEDIDLEVQEPYVREERKVGRNEPCPCNSGKKYKKCCGR